MNILYVGYEKGLNGGSRSLINLISHLECDLNNNIYVLTSFGEGPFFDELQKHRVTVIVKKYYPWILHKSEDNKWVKQKIKYRYAKSIINNIVGKQIANFIKDKDIQIIHTNSSVINIGGIAHKYSGVYHIWHIREFGDLDFGMYPLLSRKETYGFMNRNADVFVANSIAVAEHYTLLDRTRMMVIYNGVDSNNVIKYHTHHENINILLAARYEPSKGQDDAFKACRQLLKEGYQNFHIFFAGSGYPSAVDHDIQKYVSLLGNVNNLPELRKKIDIELVCSRCEAFGRVTAEAMLSKIAVIGTRSGGTPELIQDGVTGLLYESGNYSELCHKIEYLIDNNEIRVQLGCNAQNYAIEHFTDDIYFNNINTLYQQALSSDNRSGG